MFPDAVRFSRTLKRGQYALKFRPFGGIIPLHLVNPVAAQVPPRIPLLRVPLFKDKKIP
jgi:hypothetical protein